MKLSEIAKELQGALHGQDQDMPSIAIDSRKIKKDDMFIAIKGENLDGHDYIESAIDNGAKVVIAERAALTAKEKAIPFIQVENTTIALGKIGALFRKNNSIPMIGITGSCGKTTVKGMCESICQHNGKTLATKGNFNNHIGLPLTLLGLDDSIQYAVIEMGASAIGEISYLGQIARPNITMITNVKPAHLLGFGTLANVAKAKGEIYEILPEDGIAILNVEESFCDTWRQTIGNRRIITFGLTPNATVYATDIDLQPFHVQFTLHMGGNSQSVKLNIPGKHTVMNALASASAGLALNFPLSKIVEGLEAFQGVPGRLRRFKGLEGAVVIDDSYNANPGSVLAALDVLSQTQGKRVFVMGDMAELGDNAIDYHVQVGLAARQKGIEHLLAVGKLTEHAVNAFGQGGVFYPNKETLVTELKSLLNSQSIILVKGSRSAKMEVVTDALTVREGA
jgi:UDP-N-acetylmuramoyl-tripeptide--D-alanyl-D-alanine ligase